MFKAIFRFVEGLMIGVAGGYVAGLLCAPKTGKELRAEISEQSHDLQCRGEELVRKAAVNVRSTGKRVADKFDAAMTHAVNSLVDENEIIGG
jgi:gas vesicle protein